MTRRAYTLVELFIVIFFGALLLAFLIPLIRPAAAPSPLAQGLREVEAAKARYVAAVRPAPALRISLEDLTVGGYLKELTPPPPGTRYEPGRPGEPVSLRLLDR